MNDFERAVIEAARAWKQAREDHRMPKATELIMALERLNEHEQALTSAGLAEVPWAQVAEGDELRGKSGEFYPVLSTKREWKMGKPTGAFLIEVRMHDGKPRELKRTDGMATVRRGAAGKAVDTFVHVFTSGDR